MHESKMNKQNSNHKILNGDKKILQPINRKRKNIKDDRIDVNKI